MNFCKKTQKTKYNLHFFAGSGRIMQVYAGNDNLPMVMAGIPGLPKCIPSP